MSEHPILWKVRTRWAAVGAAVAVVAGAGGIAVSGATNAQLVPSKVNITPCRIMDTRSPGTVGLRSTPLGTNDTYTIQVTGKNGNCNIPADAAAVMMNVTLVSPGQGGFITVFPAGVTRPNASNLNYVAGQAPTPNLVDATLSSSGQVSFYASTGPVHLIADITSYTTGARLAPTDLAQNRWDKDRGRPSGVALGSTAWDVLYDGSSIWASSDNGDTVKRINPVTGAVDATVAFTAGTVPLDLAFDGSSVWVTELGTNTVAKIDAATATVTATVPVGNDPRGIVYDGTSIWVVNNGGSNVSKINPATNAVTGTVAVGASPYGVAFDGTSLWVTNAGAGTVSKINPTTNAVQNTFAVGTNPQAVTYDGANVWVVNYGSNSVSKIDPATSTVVATVAVGTNPYDAAFDGTRLWVTNSNSNSVSLVDPTTNVVTDSFPVGNAPFFMAFDGTSMWVSSYAQNKVIRVAAR